MSRNTKFIVAIIVVVVLVVGAMGVLAQDDTPSTSPYWPGMMGRGGYGPMMGGGFGPGMMWDGDEEPMYVVIAETLGIDQATLFTELRSGKTLAEIAEAQGVEIQAVYDAALAEMEAHMAAQVEAGYITQEQADAHLVYMQENIAIMPMFGGAGLGYGPCWSEDGSFGPGGMMGRRGHMGRGWGGGI